jgi:hypothetical protein
MSPKEPDLSRPAEAPDPGRDRRTPVTEAAAPSSDLDKAIILLTDGDNTEAWNNSNNTKITSQTTIDGRTSAACTNIKAANIKIYTVRVIDGNATLLKNCATEVAPVV